MKARLLYFFAIFLFFLLTEGCSGSRTMTRKAVQLEEAGMTEEAARYYLVALQRKKHEH